MFHCKPTIWGTRYHHFRNPAFVATQMATSPEVAAVAFKAAAEAAKEIHKPGTLHGRYFLIASLQVESMKKYIYIYTCMSMYVYI